MYALNLAEDGRILSITFEKYAAPGMPIVDTMPEGDFNDYRYEDGKYIFDPLPQPEPVKPEPTQMDILEAQVTYTAVQTGTLINNPAKGVAANV